MDQEKTQEPTEHKIQEAHKKGDFPISLDVVHLLVFSVSGIYLWFALPMFLKKTDVTSMLLFFLSLLAFPMVAIFGVLLQTKGAIKPFEIKFEKLSPGKGIKRILSKDALLDFLKNLVKTSAVVIAVYNIVLKPLFSNCYKYLFFSIKDSIFVLQNMILKTFLIIVSVFFFSACIDLLLQRKAFLSKLKMSFQDLKDEHKELEGNPQIKAKIRGMMANRLKFLMKKEVEKSTVVIVNPTHYAVALIWSKSSKGAPTVSAKGLDYLALKIIEIAKEKNVPIVTNKLLARSLFETVDVGHEIPSKHYKVVAQIIKLILRS